MKVRFGYVSHAISLWDASPAKTLTFTRYKQMSDQERTGKLFEVTKQNLNHTRRMLYYNLAHEIELYRFSSSIVPLATHPEVLWDFITPFRDEWLDLGELVRKNKLRVSFHPNQFTLFTSPQEEITENAVGDMKYHYGMLEAMGIEQDSLINIHIGGAYGDKEKAVARFHQNLRSLPASIKKVMTLENDDKTYTTEETLAVCEKEGIPLVFDYHHHMANLSEAPLEELLPRVFATWAVRPGLVPKIHISSPKTEKEFRSHADFVDPEFIMPLLTHLKKIGQDIDIMIEAKAKDQALLKLVQDLSKIRGFTRTTGASITIK